MTLLKLIEQAVRPHFAFVGKPVFINGEIRKGTPDYPFQVCSSEVNGELEDNEQVARIMIIGLADQKSVPRHEVVTELCLEEEQYETGLKWFRDMLLRARLDAFNEPNKTDWKLGVNYSAHWRFHNKYVLCKRFLERSIKAQVAKSTNQILNR
jgi:hypothetical protein